MDTIEINDTNYQSFTRLPIVDFSFARGSAMGEPGGIIKAEGAMYASKVQIVCPRCKKPTRIGHKLYEDGTKSRICVKCGEAL